MNIIKIPVSPFQKGWFLIGKWTQKWFQKLRDQICSIFEQLEKNYEGPNHSMTPGNFRRKKWCREGGGGGDMSIMEGRLLE